MNTPASQPDPRTISGIRDTNDDPVLGLKFLVNDDGADHRAVDAFLDKLRGVVRELNSFDLPVAELQIQEVANSPVAWCRSNFTLYPFYIEKLTVRAGAGMPVLQQERPGEWVVDPENLEAEPADIAEQVKDLLQVKGRTLSGGFALNQLVVRKEDIAGGQMDIRPLVLHAIAPDGRACDRGYLDSQAAIANAFWQTFWATGARRAERGATFPVVFLPIDRSSRYEFAEPFVERYVSLRRRMMGRSSILAYINEALTGHKALLFDRNLQKFCIAADFDPQSVQVAASDVLLAVQELNRTAFPDAYIGTNAETFSTWKEHDGERPAQPWPYGEPEVDGSRVSLKIRSNTKSEDYLASVRAKGGEKDLVRIHRVVPYAGCAFLYETMSELESLKQRGKVQDFDGEVLAATNSTFFLNFPEEYATLHSAMNDPVSVLVEDGYTHQVKTLRRAAFVLTEDGSASITTRVGNRMNSDVLVFEGEAASASYAHTAQKPFSKNKYGPLFFGAVIVGNSIVETFEEMATEIPANGWITGDSEAFGGRIDPAAAAEVQLPSGVDKPQKIRHAFGVGPLLLENGKVVPLGESREEFQPIVLNETPALEESAELPRATLPKAMQECEKHGVPPTRFPYDWDRTRAPRTVLGVRENGDILLVVVDGRADLPHSVGATLAELAQLMKNLGCSGAMNMDGGGSSVMFVADDRVHPNKLREHLRPGVVNLPSDMGGVERLLPVPLVIYRKK